MLVDSLHTLSPRFAREHIDHALIGGVAVSLYGPPRVTLDLDFMIEAEHQPKAHAIMLQAGFEALQNTSVFGNYRLGALRVDFLFARGEQTRGMLARAKPISLDHGTVKVLQPEDLIGLKLQALANVADRKNDWPDVQTLIERFHGSMDLVRLRAYFVLFEREHDFDRLIAAQRASKE